MMIKFKVESLKLKGLCLTAILFLNLNAFAQSAFDLANAAYADGRYEEAAAEYELRTDSKLGRLLKQRELPVLKRAKELLDNHAI